MKKNTVHLYQITVLLLVISLGGCCGDIERVPDNTIKAKPTDTVGKKKPKLPEWDEHFVLLKPKKKQHDRFKKSILNLNKPARNKIREMVEAVPKGTPRKEFLEDLSSFKSEDLKDLLNILLFLYGKEKNLIIEICAKLGDVNFWKKLRFYSLEKRLPYHDQNLLNKLIEELNIPNT